MCGIFGVVYRESSRVPAAEPLERTARLLHHRGPDAHGVWADEGIGLAHTRLALLDLNPRSDQPFWDPSRRYVLVYNGEIYNWTELRKELEMRRVAFHTTSDTEVLLQCLIHDGAAATLPRLDGMFAFGFYDTATGVLILARDRFGIKPLYVYDDGRIFAFASEIKAFRPWAEFEPEPFSVASYLLGFGGPTQNFTFYKNVKTVPSGGVVEVRRDSDARYSRFFAVPDFWEREEIEALARFSPAQMVDRMEELLFASVERQMFADAPVGAFCSGGVDSSVVMAMAARLHNNLAIFHANVKGPWSEYDAALRLSRHLKLDLRTVDVEEQDFIDTMPDVMRQYEHPFVYHPNCAPFMLVSRLVREHGVKGMLSGEGSDECFLGYPWLGRERLVDAYYRAGARLRRWVRSIPQVGRILWPWDGNRMELAADLFNRFEVAQEEAEAREAAARLAPLRIPRGNIRSVDYLNYHLRTLLHRNDCLGMEASIEARFPFLDLAVVRAAVNMPYRYKIRFSPLVFEKAHPFVRDKWVVRKVADRYVPRELSRRIKIGFWTTAFERMRTAPAYFGESFVRELFGLGRPQMQQLADEADPDLALRLLHLDVWAHVCLRDLPSEPLLDKLRDHVTLSPG